MGDSGAKIPQAAQAEEGHRSQWHELRNLLAGPERRQLDDILARLDDPVRRAEELSQALPDALSLGSARRDRMARALQPTIDAALKVSVERDPKAIADAIFPALGPAIRRAISATLMGMIQSLNNLLNQSFSLRGLRWRLEALRTRRPFGEVVLLHTLLYRVEQIFLIHRRTGVVLQQVASGEALVRDPDLVSGMLTAIQEFVKDSFDTQSGELLDTLRMDGDHSVWIEQGREAFLAVVLRGTPPLALRDRYRSLLEEIHHIFSSQWASFDGRVSAFDMIRPLLENALEVQARESKQRQSPLLWPAAAALIALALFGAWQLHAGQRQWQDFLALLRDQKGIVVISAQQRWRQFYIDGLRDPLARDPQELMAAAGLDPRNVHGRWEPYQALDETMVLRRAQQILRPPSGVQLQLHQGVLTVAGQAPHDWVVRLRRYAPAIAGVQAYDDGPLEDLQMAELNSLATQLARQSIAFALGSADLSSDQQLNLDAAFTLITQMQALRQQMESHQQIVVVGHSDPSGTHHLNMRLSLERARSVMHYLITAGLAPLHLTAVGKGSENQARDGTPQEQLSNYRRVTFQIFVDGRQVNHHD
ncbi:MAG: OmpA family protein [Desulfatitalea sp.]